MESKKTKTKSRRAPAKANKKVLKESFSTEPSIIETIDATEATIHHDNETIYIEDSNEAILTERVEENPDFSDIIENTKENISVFGMRNLSEDKKKLFVTYVPWILLVVVLISFFYFRFSDSKNDPFKSAQAETIELTNAISKIMVLPTGEVPKVATLTEADLAKIKKQTFFINAKVGDKVLVYSLARKVILYSPSLNKIIEAANLNSDAGPGSSPSL